MSNSYKYIDPDYTYTDPKTGLLRNLQDITDPDVLLFVESGAVTKRLQELYENPIKIKGVDSLFKIHKHLFQDIYVWAGKKRIVEISKDGKQFFPINKASCGRGTRPNPDRSGQAMKPCCTNIPGRAVILLMEIKSGKRRNEIDISDSSLT